MFKLKQAHVHDYSDTQKTITRHNHILETMTNHLFHAFSANLMIHVDYEIFLGYDQGPVPHSAHLQGEGCAVVEGGRGRAEAKAHFCSRRYRHRGCSSQERYRFCLERKLILSVAMSWF